MTLLFAATYPERTAAAILYGTGPSFVRADDYPWEPTREERLEMIEREAAQVENLAGGSSTSSVTFACSASLAKSGTA